VKIVSTIPQVRAWHREAGGDLGLVPTMGFLHAGHLSLVRQARAENAQVAASIFVNPTQFGPHEDLAAYPRDLDRDRALLESAGCDLLFVPGSEEMYPPGFDSFVEVGALASPLEGERRPGHFRGVATVVLKLFGIFEPTRAYFGQKDAQQLAVIRRMVRDLATPVQVIGCPIVREADGLALSSRNTYLGPEDRQAAVVLSRALESARRAFTDGERRADTLRSVMRSVLAAEPRARIDYVSVADPASFRELSTVEGPALLLLAVQVGRARLIDNLLLGA
jgi:pantoate--beta-alanine ligase